MSDELREFTDLAGSGTATAEKYGNSPAPSNQPIKFDVAYSDTVQWSCGPDRQFHTTGNTVKTIPPGVYVCFRADSGKIIFRAATIITDDLIRFPESPAARVLDSIQTFWGSKERFIARGQLFKRGILLWGPPGGGKTSVVTLLVHDLISRGGLVLINNYPSHTMDALQDFRRLEPERPVIVIHEDLDEICSRQGEHELLALLDGENQINNVVHIATTNYPERLDRRIINRPSRFDEVIKIGMPSAESRSLYFRTRITREELSDEGLAEWVTLTEGLGVAHLRELVVSVFCLGRNFKSVLERVKAMTRTPTSTDNKPVGF